MSSDIVPTPQVRAGTAKDFPSLKPHWLALYEQSRAQGFRITLPPDAFEKWTQSLIPGLQRFNTVFVAEISGTCAGFIAGRIRALPAYLGGTPVGFISEVYLAPTFRRHGLGRALIDGINTWFESQGISRVELHVFCMNEEARVFYKKLGWEEELIQLVNRI